MSYTYNTNGGVATKTDAKNQQTAYSYDAYLRLTGIAHYPTPGNEDVCRRAHLVVSSRAYLWRLWPTPKLDRQDLFSLDQSKFDCHSHLKSRLCLTLGRSYSPLSNCLYLFPALGM